MKTKTITTFGELQAGADGGTPDGMLTKITFPTMARLDERTGDGRLIRSSGFGVRQLPLSILQQTVAGNGGHSNSVVVGRLDSVTVDGNNVSGEGWLTDTPEGRAAYTGLRNGSFRGNSVDLAEADVSVNPNFSEDFEEMDDDGKPTGFFHMGQFHVDFVKASIAATTLVTTPAFANASAEVEDIGTVEEVVASFGWTIGDYVTEEVIASATLEVTVAPAAAFRRPEASEPTNITVDEDGNVFGHLGQWNDCHTGVVDRCVMIPHSQTGYGSYLKCNVHTDEGLIPTGPLMLFGGHPKQGVLQPGNVTEVYGGIENTWADVTVVDGKFGPWIAGRVRPTATAEQVYAARASNVSGHWLNGELYAVVSVNAAGYNVPRMFSTGADGQVTELIASAAPCECNQDRLSDAEVAWLELEMAALTDPED